MGGGMSGLDMTEAMARVPAGLDRELARRLLIAAETPWLEAVWSKEKPQEGA
jgi:hypothetical protein